VSEKETRKNSFKNEIIFCSPNESEKSEQRSEPQKTDNDLTDRKPMTEDNSKVLVNSYSWILSK
jgi:hypothetical protein